MKRSFILMLLMTLGVSAFCQNGSKVTIPEPGTPYNIEWKFKEFDFGKMKQGCSLDSVVFSFKVVSGVAQMTGSKSNCGCTLGQWKPDIHKAGEIGTVTIHYDTKRIGYFRKSFEVQFNRNEKPEILWITGSVEADQQ